TCKARRRNSNNGVARAVQHHVSPDYVRIRTQAPLPEGMAENQNGLRIFRAIVLRNKAASQHSADAKHGEEIAGHYVPLNDLSLARAVPDHSLRVATKGQQAAKRPIVIAVVDVVGKGQRQNTFDARGSVSAKPKLVQLVRALYAARRT